MPTKKTKKRTPPRPDGRIGAVPASTLRERISYGWACRAAAADWLDDVREGIGSGSILNGNILLTHVLLAGHLTSNGLPDKPHVRAAVSATAWHALGWCAYAATESATYAAAPLWPEEITGPGVPDLRIILSLAVEFLRDFHRNPAHSFSGNAVLDLDRDQAHITSRP